MECDGRPTDPSRRLFTIAAASSAAAWIMTACGPKRLYEPPKEKLRSAIADLERRYNDHHHKKIHVSDAGPMPGVKFAYALDISRCIGCRTCVYACVAENNQSRDPQIHWIRVMSMEKEKGVDF
jgi:ferredoxin